MPIKKRSKNPSTKPLAEFMVDSLKHPKEARSFLEAALREYEADGDVGVFLQSLRYVGEAQGGMATLAKRTGLNRQSLYKMLNPAGNPELKSVLAIIRSLGMRVKLELAAGV